VEKKGWWNKIKDDVRDAVNASSVVEEIVVVTPRNIDREGPKDENLDWLSAAKAEAGRAKLQVYDGRDIARLLDGEHQDLRYEHLHILYSRLSGQSILASCQKANSQAIAELEASRRYDPARYSTRDADRSLFMIWQHALRTVSRGGSSDRHPVRLIAIVNDSGVGKTSLLAAFVRSLGSALPAVLLQARNLAFAAEDSLVAHVVQMIQGVMDSASQNQEEAAIVRHLAVGSPLIVVLDGLDEAKNSESVRKAINYWLKSKLGQMGFLIVSSRPEFWKMCVDRGWRLWMPETKHMDDRQPAAATEWTVKRTDPTDGIRLPDRFTVEELENAWVRAARPREQLFVLPTETREELRHPFTLRVYLDLLTQGDDLPRQPTRTDLLRAWLNHRLSKESNPAERLNHQQFQQALVAIATALAKAGGGSISVDDLSGVPRFDSTHPPGPVVERLLAANILESVPGHTDRIRFVVEAVQDFYWAEAEVAAIERAPVQAAQQVSRLHFSEAYPKLSRVGQLLLGKDARHQYLDCLATIDARKAAVVMRSDPSKYDPHTRQKVVDEIGKQITARHRVHGAFAISLLSDLHCDESKASLAANLLAPAEPHSYLKEAGAEAFVKLNDIRGVELVYACSWLGRNPLNDAYYFKETLATMRSVGPEFRTALAAYAFHRLQASSGHQDHSRAVCVLAYLGDERLALHLNDRLTENGSLLEYENHALIALGTDQAGQVFFRSAKKAAENISKLGYEDGGAARYNLHLEVSSVTADHQYLYTPQFEAYIVALIHDDDKDIAYLGYDLAMRSHSPALIRHAIYALVRWQWMAFGWHEAGEDIPPESWLAWWKESTDTATRRRLLSYTSSIPSVEVEQILIECLDSSAYRFVAAQKLGRLGCYRAAPYLRQMLCDETDKTDRGERDQAAQALGLLRDDASVEPIRNLISQHPKTLSEYFGIPSLGCIGTPAAETALCSLLGLDVDEQRIAGALVFCGSAPAVSKAIELARSKPEGPKWLCEGINKVFRIHGYHRGRYYTHVATADLAAYFASVEGPFTGKDKWNVGDGVRQIDGTEIRQLLRKRASTISEHSDPINQSNHPSGMWHRDWEELMLRGDEIAIPYCLDARADDKDAVYLYFAVDNLSRFPSAAVALELRQRFATVGNDLKQIVRLLALIGCFGSDEDELMIRPFLDHPDDLVANVACESLLRLTDPMVVPEKWREI
jgi:hypothetical protein